MTFGFTWDTNCSLLGKSSVCLIHPIFLFSDYVALYTTSPDKASDDRNMKCAQNRQAYEMHAHIARILAL